MEIETPRDIALLTSKSQSQSNIASRFGFYSEYDIQSKIIGEYPPLRTYWEKISHYVKTNYGHKPTREEIWSGVNKYLPASVWIAQYYRNWNKGWLKRDFFAGLSVCFIEIPQGMAYAQLAGYPTINGLYASSFPLIVYTLFSSCKVIAGGPVAADSVLMASAIGAYTTSKHGSDDWIEIGCAIAFTAGLTLFLAGVFKLGFISSILSRPVMNGFILTAACIVVTSQLPTIFGVSTVHEDIPYRNLRNVIEALNQTNNAALVISIVACVLMFIPRLIPKFPKWIPVPIIVMILSIILSSAYNWPIKYSLKVVGDIPRGLPKLKWPRSDLFFTVFPRALIVGLVSYMDGIAMGYSVDRQLTEKYRKEAEGFIKAQEDSANDATQIVSPKAPALVEPVNVEINGSQEMIAWGLADLMGSLMGSQIISASFSRSGLLLTMEAHTLLPNLMDAIACIIVITTATSYLYYLPKCVLSAIVVVAAFRLFEDGFKEFVFLYRVSRLELIEFLATFILPLFMTLEVGICIGIGISLAVRIFKSGDAPIIELGQIYGGNLETPQIYYANVKHWKDARTIPGIKIVELRSELSFTNYRKLSDYIRKVINDDPTLKFIIICLVHSQITDSTSLREIVSIFDDISGVTICLSHLRKPVRSLLFRYRERILAEKRESSKKANNNNKNDSTDDYKYDDLLGSNVKTFISTHDAVLYCQKQLANLRIKNEGISPMPQATPIKSQTEHSIEIKYTDKNHASLEIVSMNDKKNDGNVTVDSNNDDENVAKSSDNNDNDNQNHNTDEDARLQSHVRNRFVNIPNAEKPPLQTSGNGNDGFSNNETYSD